MNSRPLHISIDLQANFLPSLGWFAEPLIEKTSAFTASLRKEGIPTLWVAWPTTTSSRNLMNIWMRHGRASGHLGLNRRLMVGAGTQDYVWFKNLLSPFAKGSLADQITNKGYTDLYISGIYRDECVTATIMDALEKTDARVHVVQDVIVPQIHHVVSFGGGNSLSRPKSVPAEDSWLDLIESNTAWYRKIRKYFPHAADRLVLTTADHLCVHASLRPTRCPSHFSLNHLSQ